MPNGGWVDQFRAGLASSEAFRAQVAAELTGEVPAKESMLSESVRDQVVQASADVADLREQLASDDQVRGEIASLIALDWLGEVPAPDQLNEPVSVDDPATEEDEPVDELVRMMPVPVSDDVEPAVEDEAATEGEAAVEDDPVDEPGDLTELPPVADDVVQAARELGIRVWNVGLLPRAQLPPSFDQRLAHAVSMGWLVVDADRIVQGEVDPRPVTVTRIPNF